MNLRISPPDPKSDASVNFATLARVIIAQRLTLETSIAVSDGNEAGVARGDVERFFFVCAVVRSGFSVSLQS